jgi:hypothetical protein
MNNFFVVLITTLLVLSGFLLFFYIRDVLNADQDGLVGDCVPLNLNIANVTATGIVVEWETSKDCLGMVRYGDSVDAMNMVAVNREKSLAAKKHAVEVGSLNPSSIYYVVVFSDGVEYGIEGVPAVVHTKAF